MNSTPQHPKPQAFVSGGPGQPCYWLPASTLSSTSISGILPGGMILKGGVASQSGAVGVPIDVNITFVPNFPNACLGVWPCTNRSVAAAGQAINGSNFATSITAAGATITIDTQTGGAGHLASWFALGF